MRGGGRVAWFGSGGGKLRPGGGWVKGVKVRFTFGFVCRASIFRLRSDPSKSCSKELLEGLSIERDPCLVGFLGGVLVGYEP